MSSSYKRIELNENIVLSSPFSPVPDTTTTADTMDILAQQGNLTVTLPDARQGSAGQRYLVRNIGENNSFEITNNNGFTLFLPPPSDYMLILTDSTTEAGTWSSIRLSVSANNMITNIEAETNPENETAVNFESSGIQGSTITLTLGVSDTLKGINTLGENEATGAGLIVRSGEESDSKYNIVTLEAGTGIRISNPSGVDGNPTISIEPVQSNYAIGSFQFNGSEISSTTGEELKINNAEGHLTIQGMRFDSMGNVTSTTNEGLGRAVATAWVRFTDISDNQNPLVGQSYNVREVRENRVGVFTVEFIRGTSTTDYAVTLGMTATRQSASSPYEIYHPRVINVTSTYVQIGVFTAEGQLVTGSSGGNISVAVFGDGDRVGGIGT